MVGAGRLADPEQIVAATLERLGVSQDLAGETVLVTAGPTHEPIDPVRYLGNRSSGKMGYALAEAALRRGAKVDPGERADRVAAAERRPRPSSSKPRSRCAPRCSTAGSRPSIIIMAAAVADYHVKSSASEKIKRNGRIDAAARAESRHPCRPGQPAAGGGKTHAAAHRLRRGNRTTCWRTLAPSCSKKRVDAIVLNDVSRADIGFNSDRNEVTIVTADETIAIPEASKLDVAQKILDAVVRLRQTQATLGRQGKRPFSQQYLDAFGARIQS